MSPSSLILFKKYQRPQFPIVGKYAYLMEFIASAFLQLEKLDSPEGNFDESDFEADEDDLPPLNERQVVKLEAAFNKGKSSYSVRSTLTIRFPLEPI